MIKQTFRLFKKAFSNNKKIVKYLTISIVFELISVGLLYKLNGYYGSLYDGIQHSDKYQIYFSMLYFCLFAGILVVIGGFSTFYINKLAFGLREGLNSYYLKIDSLMKTADNIEQRIQEDLKNFGERSCDFWFSILRSALKLPIFVGLVISLTQWWVGIVLVVSVIAGTIATKIVANKLIDLQVKQESNEANYRKQLTLKDAAKSTLSFKRIVKYFNFINVQIKKLTFLQSGLSQTFVLLPFFILIPLYLAKTITFGILMQTANAMGRVIDSLTILIEQRQLIVNISTCLKRMETLEGKEND